MAQTDDKKDDITLEIEEISQQEDEEDTKSDFEEDLKSDLEGNLEVDEADIVDEELFDIEREEEKTEEARIEEEFETQQAEAEEELQQAEAEKKAPLEEEQKQEPTETAQEQVPEDDLEGEIEQFADEDIKQDQVFEEDDFEEEFEQFADEDTKQDQVSEEDNLEEEFEQLAEDESPPESIAEDEDLLEIEEGDPLLAEEEQEQEPTGPPLDITAVDFLHDQNGGSIVIKTTGTPQSPSIRKSEDGTQVIVELDNVRLPDQFKRPYTTKEFPSNIGFFQAYQENENSKARFVVQVREPIEPLIRVEGNSILN